MIAKSAKILQFLSVLVILLAPLGARSQVDQRPSNGNEIFFPLVIGSLPTMPMILVPAGEFPMGCDPAHNAGDPCDPWELPLHMVYLDAFFIDQYEVNTSQFAQCETAGICRPPRKMNSNNHTDYYGNPRYANHPVIYVSWEDAEVYCSWVGKRLPTEAEWEKAARGITIRTYPWGEQSPSCDITNYDYWCVQDTARVGSYPLGASPYGVLDMSGNVWEWVSDWFSTTYYSVSPSINPTGPIEGIKRVIRGGGYGSSEQSVVVSVRWSSDPSYYYSEDHIGFRCAASAP